MTWSLAMNVHEVPFDKLNITNRDVLRELGYGMKDSDPFIEQQIELLLADLTPFVTSRFTYQIYSGKAEEQFIWLKDTSLNVGSIISSIMEGATAFAVFAATAGEYLEKAMKEATGRKDVFEEYLISAIGSCIVEKTGDYMEDVLQTELGNLMHTRRFSPGYCGWPLSDQKMIFHFLGGNPCSIELSEYFLMTPIKSISGVIGIGEHVKRNVYGCAVCNLQTCYKRKKR